MVRLENSEIILNEGNWIVSLHYMLWHLEFLVTPKCSTFKLYWPEFSKKKKKYCKNLIDSVSLYLSLSYCYIVRKLQGVSIKQINQETQKGCWLITGFQMFFVSSFHFLFLFVGSFWSLLVLSLVETVFLFSINTHSIDRGIPARLQKDYMAGPKVQRRIYAVL